MVPSCIDSASISWAEPSCLSRFAQIGITWNVLRRQLARGLDHKSQLVRLGQVLPTDGHAIERLHSIPSRRTSRLLSSLLPGNHRHFKPRVSPLTVHPILCLLQPQLRSPKMAMAVGQVQRTNVRPPNHGSPASAKLYSLPVSPLVARQTKMKNVLHGQQRRVGLTQTP